MRFPNHSLSLRFFLPALLLLLVSTTGWAQGRAQTLLQFEGVQARWQAAYASGAVARDARLMLEPADQANAGRALKGLDAAAVKSFDAGAALAAVQRAVTAAGEGAAAIDPQVQRAVAHLAQLRADYLAMDEAARKDYFARQHATPPDAARTELVGRMAAADLREVDFSSQLLLTAVVKMFARGNETQITSLPDQKLDMAVDMLWSRGVTSTRQRNLMLVAREVERLTTLAFLIALPDPEVAALLAWRSEPQAAAEREALLGAYRAEVKAGDARTIRALARASR